MAVVVARTCRNEHGSKHAHTFVKLARSNKVSKVIAGFVPVMGAGSPYVKFPSATSYKIPSRPPTTATHPGNVSLDISKSSPLVTGVQSLCATAEFAINAKPSACHSMLNIEEQSKSTPSIPGRQKTPIRHFLLDPRPLMVRKHS